MEFGNRLYELRKQKGLSQEELASRIDVSRQTISKWEIGDTIPDMDKLIALGEVFEISLDELVKGDTPESDKASEFTNVLENKVLTENNKKKAKTGIIIAAVALGIALVIDVISFIICYSLGFIG